MNDGMVSLLLVIAEKVKPEMTLILVNDRIVNSQTYLKSIVPLIG
jgi:hypothetical protein